MQRLLALCAAATALYVTPSPRLRRTTVKGDNDDVTEADVRKWMESADVDELLKGGIDLEEIEERELPEMKICLLYTSPSPRDATLSRMPSSA